MTTISINAELWKDTPEEERAKIKDIISKSGLIKGDVELVGDSAIPLIYKSDDEAEVPDTKEESLGVLSACKTACKVARDSARAKCNITFPIDRKKRRRCREAVEHAYKACRKACDVVGG